MFVCSVGILAFSVAIDHPHRVFSFSNVTNQFFIPPRGRDMQSCLHTEVSFPTGTAAPSVNSSSKRERKVRKTFGNGKGMRENGPEKITRKSKVKTTMRLHSKSDRHFASFPEAREHLLCKRITNFQSLHFPFDSLTFSVAWGICFSLKVKARHLKVLRSGTFLVQLDVF